MAGRRRKSLADAAADAVELISPDVSEIASAVGVSAVSLRAYKRGARTPSPDTVRALAAVLEERARRLMRAAAALRAADLEREARG